MDDSSPIAPANDLRPTQVMVQRLSSTATARSDSVLLALAVGVGVAMGLAVAAFRGAILVSHELFHSHEYGLVAVFETGKMSGFTLLPALLPMLGGLIVGVLLYRVLKLGGGHGVPNVLKAVATGQVNLSPAMAVKSATSPITITSGGSAGPEGPMVEIGAVVGSRLAQWAGVPRDQVGTLIGAGSAAGIAAMFNAPMGGVVFALELILRDFHIRNFAPVVIAAVVASVTSRAVLSAEPALQALNPLVFDTIVLSPVLVLQAAALGAACGAMGALMIAMLTRAHDAFTQVRAVPMWLKPAVGGLLVGLLGLLTPGVMGEGYPAVNDLVLDQGPLPPAGLGFFFLLLLYSLLKIAATGFTLGSGGTGGTFAPSMVTGAFLGAAGGLLFSNLMPDYTPDFRVYALVGMAGLVSSALGTPLAAMLIIYEVSGANYKLVFPLMVVVAVSSLVSSRLHRGGTIYTQSLLREGFDVERTRGAHSDPLATIPVTEVMDRQFVSLRPGDTLEHILDLLESTDVQAFLVTDEWGNLRGLISTDDLRSLINLGDVGDTALIAADIADAHPATITVEESAAKAMLILGASDAAALPVVDDKQTRHLAGVVYRNRLLRAYRSASSNPVASAMN